jgi:cell division protein FtsN
MSHDYAKKKKKSQASKSSGGLPPWFWLFTGIISGLFIAFLIYLSDLQFDGSKAESFEEEANQLSKEIKEQADRMREGKEALQKPTFEFYKRLPEFTIETPTPPKVKTTSKSKKSFLLQVGSFRSFQDADALKAQLIMQGLDVQISSANDWHRVQVGPYATQHSLSKAQDLLANNNIESLLMEVKEE